MFNRMTGILFFLKPCKMIFANVSPNKELKVKIWINKMKIELPPLIK